MGTASELANTENPMRIKDAEKVDIDSSAMQMRKRLISLMGFRAVVVSMVLGLTTLTYWLGRNDAVTPAMLWLYVVIAVTYVLTLIYALVVRKGRVPPRIVDIQIVGDLVVAAVLMHVTGGVQSAFSFFLPLAVVGAATVRPRRGVLIYGPLAATFCVLVSVLGWQGILPFPTGVPFIPTDLPPTAFFRELGLNIAAIVGISFLAASLENQVVRAKASLENERNVAADLLSLHEDIIRSLSSGLVTFDLDGRVLSANAAAMEILALGKGPVSNKYMAEIFPGLVDALTEEEEEGRLKRGEFTRNRGDHEQFLGISVSPLFNHLGQKLGSVVHFQDLTELRKMEESVKRGERLAVIGGLAAGVAHEIRNPLASISGSIELLTDSFNAEDENTALMEIVLREIDRLDGLVDELLNYANPQPLQKRSFDLRKLVDDTLRVFHSDKRRKGINVEFAEGDAIEIDADPEKIRQLFWNLIRNAADAARHGGGNVQIRATREGDRAVLRVQDDGPGISDDDLRKIFDPFFTTKNAGTGLGLAIVHSIAHDHGGSVLVESKAGSGAVFTVEVPK